MIKITKLEITHEGNKKKIVSEYEGKATVHETVCAVQSLTSIDDLLYVRSWVNHFIEQLEN